MSRIWEACCLDCFTSKEATSFPALNGAMKNGSDSGCEKSSMCTTTKSSARTATAGATNDPYARWKRARHHAFRPDDEAGLAARLPTPHPAFAATLRLG